MVSISRSDTPMRIRQLFKKACKTRVSRSGTSTRVRKAFKKACKRRVSRSDTPTLHANNAHLVPELRGTRKKCEKL